MFDIGSSLQRMDSEMYPRLSVFGKALDEKCVKSGGAGTGIDLAFDPLDAEVGKRDPFPPPNDPHLRRHSHFFDQRTPTKTMN
jgi:hypothetical protein